MPWELGYFDGLRNGKVGIFPLIESPGTAFLGQEYLGLYPAYEIDYYVDWGRQVARSVSKTTGVLLKSEIGR
jgi:hypothetical protein